MTTFTLIILILFIATLTIQFGWSIENDNLGLMLWFGFQILAFVYLAQQLMG